MKQKKEITIYDIASELSLSPSTVSRALKDHHSIGKETKKAVVQLANKRGYRPNSIAASLRSKKTNNIGVVVPWINRPFVSSLISGIEIETGLKGYNVIISQSHDLFGNEVENAKALYDSRVSGLVVSLAMETTEYDHIQQFIDSNIPVVFVDRVAEDLNSDIVIIDNYAAGYMATEHLIEQGCKRIAHIGGAQHRNIYNEREKGYRQALKDYKLPLDEEIIVHNDVLNHEEGLKSSEYLLSLPKPPDGIFTANDTTAVSVIQFAKNKGIKIPQELAVIGFNNDPISEIIEPQLSSITHPAVEMGMLAARQVLKHKDQRDLVKSERIILKTELVVRASSLRKHKKK
jgi:LacI family transcriptional regulator